MYTSLSTHQPHDFPTYDQTPSCHTGQSGHTNGIYNTNGCLQLLCYLCSHACVAGPGFAFMCKRMCICMSTIVRPHHYLFHSRKCLIVWSPILGDVSVYYPSFCPASPYYICSYICVPSGLGLGDLAICRLRQHARRRLPWRPCGPLRGRQLLPHDS